MASEEAKEKLERLRSIRGAQRGIVTKNVNKANAILGDEAAQAYGCLPFTRNFGKFPLGISVGKSAFHLDTNLIRSQAPLCRPLEFPAKIQNGGSDVDAA